MAHAVHVLVVDDNVDARDALSRLLEAAGHAVTCVVNGQEALRWLEEGGRADAFTAVPTRKIHVGAIR